MKEFDDEIIELDSSDEEQDFFGGSEEQDNSESKESLEKENTKEEEVVKEEDEVLVKREDKYHKKTLKEKWEDLSKKQKIIFFVVLGIILCIIIAIVLFMIFNKKEPTTPNDDTPVIVEKDNYKYSDGNLIFLDDNDNEIGKYECTNKSDTDCMIAKLDNKNDIFDRVKNVNVTGEEIISNSKIYFKKFVFVQDGEDKFLYNISNSEKLPISSLKADSALDNIVVIEDTANKFGLIEFNQDEYNYLIRPSYDYLGIINPTLKYILAKDGDNYYVIDSEGKKLSSNFKASITSLNSDFIVAKTNRTYSLYDYDYNELVSDYDYISLNDDIISLVKSNRLYLLDNHLNKLNEDGVRLESLDNLTTVNVYENNRLKEVKSAYSIEVKGNIAYVTVNNNTKEINMLDGIISSNYDLISYFDGKLYFYSDKDKDDVIGTYTCENKNTLNSTSDTLSKCTVYKVNDLYSGIYNNEYVFIYDNIASDLTNIYLYDLKTNRVRSTYSEIIINGNELNEEIKPIYTSTSYIISKSATGNNAGNYGVLEINGSTVKGKIDYKYKEIRKENDYYLLTGIDNTYTIYTSNFEKLSTTFDMLTMYDNYYVGIQAGKLNIYRYEHLLYLQITLKDLIHKLKLIFYSY